MSKYQEIADLLQKNNRKFKSSDANTCYFDLITQSKIEETLAYNICSLLDKLQFSAWEMWIGDYYVQSSPLRAEEVNLYLESLPKNIESFSYYSPELVTYLISLYNNLKDLPHKTDLESHLSRSLAKELYTYRRGHTLVKKEKGEIL